MDPTLIPPPEAEAGKDFDQWFDWNGATSPVNSGLVDIKPYTHGVLPISPLSASHSDFKTSIIAPQSLTAPPHHDLPTPDHSSSSPDARSVSDLRLSGETLRDDRPTNPRPLKRKLSPNAIPAKPEELTPAAKKRPHNIIEKRYRANLNEKIAELRDSVPSLRSIKKARERDESGQESEEDDLNGLTPSNKLNKASILTKAVEYIKHLEFRTKRLEDENKSLKDRLETLDKVIAHGGQDSQRAAAFTSEAVIEQGSPNEGTLTQESSSSDSSPRPVQGLIPIPESWRRLRQDQSQEHYGHIYDSPQRSFIKGKWPSRIMVGSLAGLMVMEGFSESDQGTSSREKGLFGIPLELLDGWKFLRSPRLYLAAFAQFCRAGGVVPLIKGFLALTILAFIIFAYLFNSKPPPKDDIEGDAPCSDQTAAPASPISVRRRAWSTSMQVLKLPHHSFFPEWMAVTAEWLKYTVRYLFGYKAYSWLTGRSAEDDAARIKAWDIAIDAQLAGGDVEVSRSRVVLTSFGSGTLPASPLRLMQKALHCRVLLWNVGQRNNPFFHFFGAVGKFFAEREWTRARRLHDGTTPQDVERLPPNLAALLAMDCEDVFTDTVVQRAYNLMYDRPTQEQSEDCLLDVVVEDHAIRSPLDAVAAWRSTTALRKAFETSLQCPNEIELLQEDLEMALRIAPPGSTALARALAGHALFGCGYRNGYYHRALEMIKMRRAEGIPTPPEQDCPGPYFIDSSTPTSARSDIDNCLLCAKALISLDHDSNVDSACNIFTSQPLESNKTTILTHAAMKHVQHRLPRLQTQITRAADEDEVGAVPSPFVRSMSADSLLSMTMSPLRMSTKTEKSRRLSSDSNDTGYESMDENDLCKSGRNSFDSAVMV